MRWTSASKKNPQEWHRWFAWFPVTIDGERVWLETVERRRVWVPCHPDGTYDVYYRNPPCSCKDRAAKDCPGEWEPGCDLGANEQYVRVYEPMPGSKVVVKSPKLDLGKW